MSKVKSIFLTLSAIFFTACGTETYVDPNRSFDMWDYMTSASNYEVSYDVYENGRKVDEYFETHRQFGDEYERVSNTGTSRLFLSAGSILMQEPNNNSITIVRFLHLGDRNIFQSADNRLCTLNSFYNNYKAYHNVVQVICESQTGLYQEFYYGYNEGIVNIIEEYQGVRTEYLKVGERAIF